MAKPHNIPHSVKINQYHALLMKWSKVINLVAPSTLADAKIRHFDDSLQLLPLLPNDAKILIDIGSGAGFPGMVLAMERPDVKVHMVESDTKKCSFLATVSRETNTPVIIHNQRIESVDKLDGVIPDVITARALASLSELLSLTKQWWDIYPHVTLIFPKGEKWQDEINEAKKSYDFKVEITPSLTSPTSSILVLTEVRTI